MVAAEIGSLQLPTCAGALSCMVWVVVTGRPTVLEAQAQVAEREPKPFARRLATTTGSGHISVHGGGQRDAARPKSCIFEANHYDFEQSQESRAEQSRGEERRGEERRGEESRGRRKRERERERAESKLSVQVPRMDSSFHESAVAPRPQFKEAAAKGP